MVELTNISIAAFGTKATKDKAKAEGKDPELKFQAPIVDLSTVDEDTPISEVAKAFQQAYGVTSPKEQNVVSWFLGRCNKHLQDAHRASFHREGMDPQVKALQASVKQLSPEKLAELAKLLNTL